MMQPKYNAIYLAPHLDDAALSCGGQIYTKSKNGEKILIVTIMAGDPPTDVIVGHAVELHERWEIKNDVIATRRAEDTVACKILGADYVHWQIPDCIYRFVPETNIPFYPTWPEIIGKIHPQEIGLVQNLTKQFSKLPTADRVLAPLTIGNHVDHQIVRQAAELCFIDNLFYYEDYPYVQTTGALDKVIPKGSSSWMATQIPLSAKALQIKADAITAYKSQLSTFFNGRNDLEQQLNSYAAQIGGERIWYIK